MLVSRQPLKCAVIGLGFIGNRHIAMIEAHPELKLVALCDSDVSKHVQSVYPCFLSLDEMLLQHPDLDALSICVPNHLHVPFSIKGIEAGAHIICEKPLGLDSDNTRKMLALAEEKGKKVFCVLQNRYSPTVKWLTEMLKEKRLGRIFTVQVNCFWNRDDRYYFAVNEKGEKQPHAWHGKLEKDGGPLHTQFSHFIDVMIALFGRLEIVRASFQNFNHQHSTEFEDTGFVTFKTEQEVIGTLSYTTSVWDTNQESSINIIGEKGSIKVGGQYMNRLDYCHVENYEIPTLPDAGAANNYGGYTGSANNHFYVYENVAKVLLHGAKSDFPVSDSLLGVEIIEAIYRLRS